jgi:hypothetical protein
MLRVHLVCLTWLALALSNAPAQEPAKPPKGPPPGFFQVTEIDKSIIELKGPGTTSYRSAISDLEIYDAAGKKLGLDEFRKRVKAGSVVLAASDEHNVDPAYLGVVKQDTVVLRGVTVLLARADNPGRGWTTDLKQMKSSDDPVTGRILGTDFKPEKIQLLNTGLSLRSGKDTIHVFLNLKPGQAIEGKSFEWNPEDPQGQGRPSIHVHVHSTKPLGVQAYTTGYAMRLEFGKEKDGSIPGKLYLCLPDERKSWIAGSFTLDLR